MSKHTPGPWRWEYNASRKSLALLGGGKRQYDLTVIDFVRCGMTGATARLRDMVHDDLNQLHALPSRRDWIAPFPGRPHHASWCAGVTHPDLLLSAAAPALLEALRNLTSACVNYTPPAYEAEKWPTVIAALAAIASAEGRAP